MNKWFRVVWFVLCSVVFVAGLVLVFYHGDVLWTLLSVAGLFFFACGGGFDVD